MSGVPVNAPVAVSKIAHSGVPVIEYIRVVFASASAPLGVNEYATSSLTVVDGVPVIVGASFSGVTVTVNLPVVSVNEPSDTVYVMISVPLKSAAGV